MYTLPCLPKKPGLGALARDRETERAMYSFYDTCVPISIYQKGWTIKEDEVFACVLMMKQIQNNKVMLIDRGSG